MKIARRFCLSPVSQSVLSPVWPHKKVLITPKCRVWAHPVRYLPNINFPLLSCQWNLDFVWAAKRPVPGDGLWWVQAVITTLPSDFQASLQLAVACVLIPWPVRQEAVCGSWESRYQWRDHPVPCIFLPLTGVRWSCRRWESAGW